MTPFAKFIVIVNSEKELADRVLFFIKNPKKEKEMIEIAFDWARGQSWEKVIKLYVDLWNV